MINLDTQYKNLGIFQHIVLICYVAKNPKNILQIS